MLHGPSRPIDQHLCQPGHYAVVNKLQRRILAPAALPYGEQFLLARLWTACLVMPRMRATFPTGSSPPTAFARLSLSFAPFASSERVHGLTSATPVSETACASQHPLELPARPRAAFPWRSERSLQSRVPTGG
jgi:hypothetical protein